MTDNETLTLMMALVSDRGFVRARDLRQGLDVSMERVWQVCASLRGQGALTHHSYGLWQITEKGRIACALAMHKDPTLRQAFFDEEPA